MASKCRSQVAKHSFRVALCLGELVRHASTRPPGLSIEEIGREARQGSLSAIMVYPVLHLTLFTCLLSQGGSITIISTCPEIYCSSSVTSRVTKEHRGGSRRGPSLLTF